MTTSIDNYLALHASALTLRGQRTKMLANNMANADTPNYKAQDIDFGAALREQISGQQSRLKTTHTGHIPFAGSSVHDSHIKYRIPQEASLDGNTVDTDVEQSQFAENTIRYQASLHFLNKRITGLLGAIKGE